MTNQIIIAGDGHGAVSLYKGVKKTFSKVYVFTNTQNEFSLRKEDQFITDFFDVDCRYVICSAYYPLISREILDRKRFLNIHYAPLPKNRGMHPIVWGILNNDRILGWTLHEIDEFMDSGSIIFQDLFKNDFKSTSVEFMRLFNKSVEEKIGRVLKNYLEGKIKPSPQDKSIATWGAKRNLRDCKINFEFTHDEIKSFFRALVLPYPLPYIEYKEMKYFIKKYKLHNANIAALTLGRVVNIDNEGLWIKTKEGYLVVNDLCLDCKTDKYIDLNSNFRIGARLDVKY